MFYPLMKRKKSKHGHIPLHFYDNQCEIMQKINERVQTVNFSQPVPSIPSAYSSECSKLLQTVPNCSKLLGEILVESRGNQGGI